MHVNSLMEKLQRELYKKFKSIKLHVDEEIYKVARNTVHNLIRKKKKAYFEEKLKESTANPKKLWKTLKFDPFTFSKLFKKLYSSLTNDLVQKLPAAARKFDIWL